MRSPTSEGFPRLYRSHLAVRCRGAMGLPGAMARRDQRHTLGFSLNPGTVDGHSVGTAI